ncbi:hypothetical protein HYC85_004968 [Camellia sinensis]|uniref:Uncharacterized protein n=1 Tax=Camellia sinensis TaxID=4442 RepID=A0A7J7HY27_CAMSI|nr:hypothetical protein HYC85_004968 [Camellia sinensis]
MGETWANKKDTIQVVELEGCLRIPLQGIKPTVVQGQEANDMQEDFGNWTYTLREAKPNRLTTQHVSRERRKDGIPNHILNRKGKGFKRGEKQWCNQQAFLNVFHTEREKVLTKEKNNGVTNREREGFNQGEKQWCNQQAYLNNERRNCKFEPNTVYIYIHIQTKYIQICTYSIHIYIYIYRQNAHRYVHTIYTDIYTNIYGYIHRYIYGHIHNYVQTYTQLYTDIYIDIYACVHKTHKKKGKAQNARTRGNIFTFNWKNQKPNKFAKHNVTHKMTLKTEQSAITQQHSPIAKANNLISFSQTLGKKKLKSHYSNIGVSMVRISLDWCKIRINPLCSVLEKLELIQSVTNPFKHGFDRIQEKNYNFSNLKNIYNLTKHRENRITSSTYQIKLIGSNYGVYIFLLRPGSVKDGATVNGVPDALRQNPLSLDLDMNSKEYIEKLNKYEADHICRVMAKYFSDKDIYGDPVQFLEDESSFSSTSPADSSTVISNGTFLMRDGWCRTQIFGEKGPETFNILNFCRMPTFQVISSLNTVLSNSSHYVHFEGFAPSIGFNHPLCKGMFLNPPSLVTPKSSPTSILNCLWDPPIFLCETHLNHMGFHQSMSTFQQTKLPANQSKKGFVVAKVSSMLNFMRNLIFYYPIFLLILNLIFYSYIFMLLFSHSSQKRKQIFISFSFIFISTDNCGSKHRLPKYNIFEQFLISSLFSPSLFLDKHQTQNSAKEKKNYPEKPASFLYDICIDLTTKMFHQNLYKHHIRELILDNMLENAMIINTLEEINILFELGILLEEFQLTSFSGGYLWRDCFGVHERECREVVMGLEVGYRVLHNLHPSAWLEFWRERESERLGDEVKEGREGSMEGKYILPFIIRMSKCHLTSPAIKHLKSIKNKHINININLKIIYGLNQVMSWLNHCGSQIKLTYNRQTGPTKLVLDGQDSVSPLDFDNIISYAGTSVVFPPCSINNQSVFLKINIMRRIIRKYTWHVIGPTFRPNFDDSNRHILKFIEYQKACVRIIKLKTIFKKIIINRLYLIRRLFHKIIIIISTTAKMEKLKKEDHIVKNNIKTQMFKKQKCDLHSIITEMIEFGNYYPKVYRKIYSQIHDGKRLFTAIEPYVKPPLFPLYKSKTKHSITEMIEFGNYYPKAYRKIYSQIRDGKRLFTAIEPQKQKKVLLISSKITTTKMFHQLKDGKSRALSDIFIKDGSGNCICLKIFQWHLKLYNSKHVKSKTNNSIHT